MKSPCILLTLSIVIAIIAILASQTLFSTPPRVFIHNPFDILYGIKAISYSAITSVCSHHHHHHHRRKPSHSKKKISICGDFPKNIPPPDTDTTSYLCVDKNGCCNFTTVQSAVDAIGNFSERRNVIWINSGMYYEKVAIPKTKPNITLQGQGFETTSIAWNDTAYSANGTFYCASVQVFGSQFLAKNISFMDCQIISMANQVSPGSKSINGAVTANGRNSKDENSGFSFVNCSIGGTGHVWLGRAWRPYSRVIFVSTFMTDVIAPEGWNNFNDPSRDATIFYGEYNCSGPGANISKRAQYVQKLNETQVAQFINMTIIDGDQWLQYFDI
ncbi:unnamed protein product [Brassica napus]|uniref:pectinesterase n=2 Tax=Brassica TaxID=3705 RepID=A0A817ATZ6_BRANA|nr:unnamed protein product [Brassica napus]